MKTGFTFKSLKMVISMIVTVIIVVLSIVLITSSYNIAYNAVQKAFVNQMKNFESEINRQIDSFYDKQKNTAVFLADLSMVKAAVSRGQFDETESFMKDYARSQKVYQDLFISTAESNPRIVSSILSNAEEKRWGNETLQETIDLALQGETAVSPIVKSQITGLPVALVLAPVKSGNSISALMCMTVNVGEFSQDIVQGVKIGKTGYPYLVNNKGVAVAHPDKSLIFDTDISEFSWGQKVLSGETHDFIGYDWKGAKKLLTYSKNDTYNIIAVSSIDNQDINSEARTMAWFMIAIGVAGIIIAAIIIYILVARKLHPLEECKEVMTSFAGGDLTARYTSNVPGDEIGDIVTALNSTVDQFEDLISEIMVSAENLGQAVQQIASGNENLSQRTSEQASSLEEIASTLEEATANIKQNAENSNEADSIANNSSKMAEDGGKVVEDAIVSINEISTTGNRIGEIITVINEIAFQTNLLALNAAVEAARAGDQGRGFAVVAGEVRNLAQRAGQSAKEISDLINDSQEKISNGTELVNKSGESLREIIGSVKQVSRYISEIASASDEQRRGIEQINTAVVDMDTMTQQNAAMVEETASASEEMANQAQQLLDRMSIFTISQGENHRKTGVKKPGNGAAYNEAELKGHDKGNGNGKDSESVYSNAAVKTESGVKNRLTEEGFEEF
ncbi:MAG: methyl-accepting chemotaxis protein [Spirochaetota bacterium]